MRRRLWEDEPQSVGDNDPPGQVGGQNEQASDDLTSLSGGPAGGQGPPCDESG
jgi:hypothetical protein